MQDLLSLLFFAGLFFVLMRFGCCAHKKHDHKKHKPSQQKYTDPVCGAQVDSEEGYEKTYERTGCRFCSKPCRQKFVTNPELYAVNKLSDDSHHQGDVL
ncbi:hypothetical protein MNBD_GAMMA07-2758 [hydrothermal vent metagenome]|uniref:Uncharacterized protein n=1 Tax=hydrothermal vent metagenome TaxID=652676 RepID=A0A3B0X193_9ZZZZ